MNNDGDTQRVKEKEEEEEEEGGGKEEEGKGRVNKKNINIPAVKTLLLKNKYLSGSMKKKK